MTERELALCRALKGVTLFPGTAKKRFTLQMIYHAEHYPDKDITPKQSDYLEKLGWTFRRQMPRSLLFPTIGPRSRPSMFDYILEVRDKV